MVTADLSARVEARLAEVEAALDADEAMAGAPVEVYADVGDGAGSLLIRREPPAPRSALIVLAVNGLRASIAATRDVLARHEPLNDDGATYCGWAGDRVIVRGCGHAWPCPEIANEARRWQATP